MDSPWSHRYKRSYVPFVEPILICQVSLKVDVTDIYLNMNRHAMNIYSEYKKGPDFLVDTRYQLKMHFPELSEDECWAMENLSLWLKIKALAKGWKFYKLLFHPSIFYLSLAKRLTLNLISQGQRLITFGFGWIIQPLVDLS